MADPIFSLPNPPAAAPRKRKVPTESEAIEALIEEAARAPVLTGEGLESYKTSLIEAILENDRQRERHADEPEHFFESESTLYELLHRLAALAVDSQLVERVLSSGSVGEQVIASVLSLLATHPNDDIVELILRELLDVIGEDNASPSSITQQFVSLLERMGIYGALLDAATPRAMQQHSGELYVLMLELLQDLLSYELAPCDSEALVEGWPLLLTASVLDESLDLDTRVLCAELLLGLVSLSSTVREQMAMGGLARLIKILSGSHVEATASDLLPLVSDIICACLLEDACLQPFLEAGGLSSCLALITRPDPAQYGSAMQVLSFALLAGPPACKRFIEVEEGLKYLFPLFMGRHHTELAGKHASQGSNSSFDTVKDMEVICTMLQCLFRYIKFESAEWNRLVRKFREHNMEKTDRLTALLSGNNGKGARFADNQQLQTACCLAALDLLQLPGDEGLAFKSRVSPELQNRIQERVADYIKVLDPEDPYRQRLGRYLENFV